MKFKELGLREEIITAVDELGFEEAMPIQEKSIPFIKNESKDLVALAQTGTGKTAAFGLPILDSIDENVRATQALVIAPTRELCVQISNDLKNFSKHIKGMKIVPVYGGENIITQLRQLDVTPQIVVATPGRLIDLMKRKKVDLGGIRYLVLDEADEMLNMGFKEDIETILESTPESRRTFLFSATMPKDVEEMSRNYMGEREQITIGTKNSGNENVEHVYYMVQAKDRYLALKRIVDMNPDIYAIIFCRTRQETQEVAEKLMKDGYMEAVDIEQLDAFKAGILFAQTEGIIPAPESCHAIAATVNEALKCKETGEKKTILFNLSGHGFVDMSSYDQYLSGEMQNFHVSDAELAKYIKSADALNK